MKHFVLLSDDIHIHARNFKPLFDYFQAERAEVVVHDKHGHLKKRYGLYDGCPEIRSYIDQLGRLDNDALLSAHHHYHAQPIPLMDICRSECLAYILATSDQIHREATRFETPLEWTNLVDQWLVNNERDAVIQNMAAVMFWIDEWQGFLDNTRRVFTEAFVFGGSPTYMRALMHICRWYKTRVFVLESTFTGNEFYLEERYSPLGNKPDIRLPTVRNSYAIPTDEGLRHRETLKAVEKLLLSKNKNVSQPPPEEFPRFSDPSRPRLLLVGQVVNDFSIIDQQYGWLSTIAFYRELISKVLRHTDYNIVFKGHPWEEKKVHLMRPRTIEALRELEAGEGAGRFLIRNHHNLSSLGKQVDQVAMLNSQAGIELAFFCGLRPATFGNPFYGGAGFNDEYNSIDIFVEALQSRRRGHLSLPEFEELQLFLLQYLQYDTVTVRSSGLSQVKQKLARRDEILLAKALKVANAGTDKRPVRHEPPSPKPDRTGRSRQESEPALSPHVTIGRKLRKLARNPKGFVRDSKLVKRLWPS